MGTLTYRKLFTEFRYPGQIEIFDEKSKVVKQYYPNLFPHWSILNGSSIKLHSDTPIEKSFETLLIEHKRFAYSVEDPSTNNYFIDKTLKYFKKIESISEIPIINRLGVRSYYFFGPIDFDSYLCSVKRSELIFSSSFNDLSTKIGGYNDLMLTVVGDKHRIVFGPIKKDEKNSYTEEIVNKDILNNSFGFIDIDNYEVDISIRNYPKELEKIYNKQNEMINSIQDYFMEKCNG